MGFPQTVATKLETGDNLFRMTLNVIALRNLFTGTKRPKPARQSKVNEDTVCQG